MMRMQCSVCRGTGTYEEPDKNIPATFCPVCDGSGEMEAARPRIVCLCGSTRFSDAFKHANLTETLAGKMVFSIGCDFKSDDMLGLTEADKDRLDVLHLHKIDAADEILVLNVDGYVGESTAREVAYAIAQQKHVRYLEMVTMPSSIERIIAASRSRSWETLINQHYAARAAQLEVL